MRITGQENLAKKGDCRDKFFRKDPAETKRPVLLKLARARRQIETNHGLSDNPLIIAGGTRFDAASNGLKEQYFNINILYSAAYKWCVVRRVAANDFYLGFKRAFSAILQHAKKPRLRHGQHAIQDSF